MHNNSFIMANETARGNNIKELMFNNNSYGISLTESERKILNESLNVVFFFTKLNSLNIKQLIISF